jgi:hypothetical protein
MIRSGDQKGKSNYKIFSAGEFIAAITQHIPEKSFQLIRYYGWYSNRSRGGRLKDEQRHNADKEVDAAESPAVRILDVSNYKPKRIPSPKWRECIKKIWEVDPLECPRCQAEMKIVSFIDEAVVIEKILRHLKLWEKPEPRVRPPPEIRLPDMATVVYEPCDDGCPEYEQSFVEVF